MKKLIEQVSKTRFTVPENWGEITLGVHSQLLKKDITDVEVVSLLTGINKGFVETLGELFVIQMLQEFVWLNKDIDSDTWTTDKVIDIRKESIGELYQLENVFNSQNKIYEAIKIYFVTLQPETMLLSEAVPLAKSIFDQLAAYQKVESDQLKSVQTGEQMRAGIKKFDRFGRMNTIDALAGGDITKYEEVLKVDVNTVLIKLQQMKEEVSYKNNYSNIMNEKAARK